MIIAPGLARIANRTDTSPVRLARASPGIDSDAAPRFPASRNPMAAQVFAPCRGAALESRRKGLVHRGGAAVVGWLLRRDTSRAFPRPAPVARRALSARLVAAVNPSRRYAAKPPAASPLGSSAVSPTLALDSGVASGGAATPSAKRERQAPAFLKRHSGRSLIGPSSCASWLRLRLQLGLGLRLRLRLRLGLGYS